MRWQPIETAPKDNTPILIWDGEDISLAEWNDIGRKWNCLCGGGAVWDGDGDTGGLVAVYSATHWMPLPSPPTGPDQRPGIGQDREQG
jgi:hypothetical protein